MKLDLKCLKYAVFDWDNTLAESRTPLLFALNKVLEANHLPSWSELVLKRDRNLSFRDNFVNYFGDRAADIYEQYAQVYLENVASLIKTFDYVPEVLSFLRKSGIKLMIMSNKDRRLLEYELPLLFDPKLFEKIVCGHEALRDKPYPEHLYYTLEGYLPVHEISPESVWMIGDSPQDSRCALAANARPIRIGKDIWQQSGDTDSRIVSFDDFKQFYSALRSDISEKLK